LGVRLLVNPRRRLEPRLQAGLQAVPAAKAASALVSVTPTFVG
jgi:uncharacterized membrane protein